MGRSLQPKPAVTPQAAPRSLCSRNASRARCGARTPCSPLGCVSRVPGCPQSCDRAAAPAGPAQGAASPVLALQLGLCHLSPAHVPGAHAVPLAPAPRPPAQLSLCPSAGEDLRVQLQHPIPTPADGLVSGPWPCPPSSSGSPSRGSGCAPRRAGPGGVPARGLRGAGAQPGLPQVPASPQPAARRGAGLGAAAHGGGELRGVHPVSFGCSFPTARPTCGPPRPSWATTGEGAPGAPVAPRMVRGG